MPKSEAQQLQEAVNRFIGLANEIANEGEGQHLVSAALMSASAVYSTYVAGGNEAVLTDAGMEKVVEMYQLRLKEVQEARRAELEGKRGS